MNLDRKMNSTRRRRRRAVERKTTSLIAQVLIIALAITSLSSSSSSSSSPLTVVLVQAKGQNDNNSVDYTCDPLLDYGGSSECSTLGDGTCDNPNHGGKGGDKCINQDCIDCNYHCGEFDADCYGCLGATGCYYCPGDATCQNSDLYQSSNKALSCAAPTDFWLGGRDDPSSTCVSPDSITQDPLVAANTWVYEMINVIPVWENLKYTGKGIKIRINDDGVDVDNLEFSGNGKFDEANSCAQWRPLPTDPDGHGTAVAGIVSGNANNDNCAAGIAYDSSFSACNFFAEGVAYSALAYKVETFDISQNSIGTPACTDGPANGNRMLQATCPFTVPEGTYQDPCDAAFCNYSDTQSLSMACENAIVAHCKANYREDSSACADFNDVIIRGGCDYDKLPKSAIDALQEGITKGRDGKGVVFVFASGNAFYEGDDVNMSRWTNSRYTITVGAVGKDGIHTDYSTPGAALHVTGPAGDYDDVSQIMTAGLNGKCTNSGPGTSFSCPVVSGVIALILEARPELTWRDVQGILASTSNSKNDARDRSAMTNKAGFWHSDWYGFGIIDAKKAVDAALKWELWTPEQQAIGESKEENKMISNDGTAFTSELTIGPEYKGFKAESAVVLLNLQHYNRGDLQLTLVSPSGTESVLHAGKRPEDNQLTGDQRWKLMTVRNWGEDPTGKWKLKVQDLVTDNTDTEGENEFRQWKLTVYGQMEDMPELSTPTTSPTKAALITSSPTKATTTAAPTESPTNIPTASPVVDPTSSPVVDPTNAPVVDLATNPPTSPPTLPPSKAPVAFTPPPFVMPEVASPTTTPTKNATITSSPTKSPTTAAPTKSPTKGPTTEPVTVTAPTEAPTNIPTASPVVDPTSTPVVDLTNAPVPVPLNDIVPTPTYPPIAPTNPSTTPPMLSPTKALVALTLPPFIVVRPTTMVRPSPLPPTPVSAPVPTLPVLVPDLIPVPQPTMPAPVLAPVRTLPPYLQNTVTFVQRPTSLIPSRPSSAGGTTQTATQTTQTTTTTTTTNESTSNVPIRPTRISSFSKMGAETRTESVEQLSFVLEEVSEIQTTPTTTTATNESTSNVFIRPTTISISSTIGAAETKTESVEHLSLVLIGVSEIPESSMKSIQAALEEHTNSVVATILPALHFHSTIQMLSVTANDEVPERQRRRNLRTEQGPSVTIVYNELVEFELLHGTEDLKASTLASLAFQTPHDRVQFVNKIHKEFSNGDSILQSLVEVSMVALPPSPSPTASPTQSPVPTLAPSSSSSDKKESGNDILTIFGEINEVDPAITPTDGPVSAVSIVLIVCWVSIGIGLLAGAAIVVMRRRHLDVV